MPVFEDSAETQLTYRENTWDSRVLNQPVWEITSFAYDTEENLRQVLTRAGLSFGTGRDGLVVARVNAADQCAVSAFQACGFRYAEASQMVRLRSLKRFTPPTRVNRKLELRVAVEADIPRIKGISREEFHHGRYAEDWQIPLAVHQKRQDNWIDDIFAAGQPVVVFEAKGVIHAFMAYSLSDSGEAQLMLGGCDADHGFLAIIFWVNVLEHLREQGAKSVSALISAANLGIVNLYSALGFEFSDLLIGLHRSAE